MNSQIFYSRLIGKKTFKGSTVKDAYLRATKWYASNVIAKDELHEIQVEFIKGINQVTLKLYVVLPEQAVRDKHCEICREAHQSFFINEATNCGVCKLGAYQRRLDQKMLIKLGYYKGIFNELGVDDDGK